MSWKLRLLAISLASFLISGCGTSTDEAAPADEPPGGAAKPVDKVKKPPVKLSTSLTKEPTDMETKSPEPDKTPPKPEPAPVKADPPKPIDSRYKEEYLRFITDLEAGLQDLAIQVGN